MRPLTALISAAACAALLAAPAHAAYAPRVDVTVAPAAAGGPVALDLDVAQAAEEEATRSLRLTLLGFGTAAGLAGRPACAGAASAAGACPPESRIGSASSTTTFGTFSGGVFLTGVEGETVRVLAVLSNPLVPLVLDQRLPGTLTPVPGGRQLAFDELPGATATRLRLTLDGLLAAPTRCGNYDSVARLTSHRGEAATRTQPLGIGGCAGAPPRLGALRLRRGALSFTLAEPAAVRITARRAGTRRVRTLRRLSARAGRTTVRAVARGLAPGRWRLTVRAADADGASARTLTLRVVPRA